MVILDIKTKTGNQEMTDESSAINERNVQITLTTILADQAVLQQQIDAMDSFDEGFDALTNEIEEKFVAINWLLPQIMDYAGQQSSSIADGLWKQIVPAMENAMQLVARLSDKIQLANALRGRGVAPE
jgi:hypothetical protein